MSKPELYQPYQPCPCGSGEKYKFCCRSTGKFNSPPPIDVPEEEEEIFPEDSFRESFEEYAQPLLEKANGSRENEEKAALLAALCWNLALLNAPGQAEFLEDTRNRMGMSPELFADFRRDILEPMVQRHREMFPELNPSQNQMLRNTRAS